MVIINTNAAEVSIHAVSPLSIFGGGAGAAVAVGAGAASGSETLGACGACANVPLGVMSQTNIKARTSIGRTLLCRITNRPPSVCAINMQLNEF